MEQRESLSKGLRDAGILGDEESERGVFDAIIVIRDLCSVKNPVDAVEFFYKSLKPGGRLIVGEHIKNRWRKGTGSIFGRLTQVLYQSIG